MARLADDVDLAEEAELQHLERGATGATGPPSPPEQPDRPATAEETEGMPADRRSNTLSATFVAC
jgi:hypothetical protein